MGLGSAVISSLGKEKAVYEDDREREKKKGWHKYTSLPTFTHTRVKREVFRVDAPTSLGMFREMQVH